MRDPDPALFEGAPGPHPDPSVMGEITGVPRVFGTSEPDLERKVRTLPR